MTSSFSNKQLRAMTWWMPKSRDKGFDALVCDGAVRSGDDVYLGARLGIAEMLLGGTTTFVDMYWHADRQAAPDHPRDRSDPAGKLHVALRIICDRHPVAEQDVHILLGQVHAVHGQRRIIENAQIAQILGRGLVVTLPDRLGLGTRLAQMDMNAQAVFFT